MDRLYCSLDFAFGFCIRIWFVGLKSRSDCSYGKMISIVDERRAIVWFNGYVIIQWLIWKCEFDFENRLIGLNAKNIRIWVSKINVRI